MKCKAISTVTKSLPDFFDNLYKSLVFSRYSFFLKTLKYKPGSQSWENGKIYDATSGRYWDSSARITKTGLLKVRGYWKFKWIGKTMTFIKINESAFTKK